LKLGESALSPMPLSGSPEQAVGRPTLSPRVSARKPPAAKRRNAGPWPGREPAGALAIGEDMVAVTHAGQDRGFLSFVAGAAGLQQLVGRQADTAVS
jgi:hypothetical protein